jgi:hypothetical protein
LLVNRAVIEEAARGLAAAFKRHCESAAMAGRTWRDRVP